MNVYPAAAFSVDDQEDRPRDPDFEGQHAHSCRSIRGCVNVGDTVPAVAKTKAALKNQPKVVPGKGSPKASTKGGPSSALPSVAVKPKKASAPSLPLPPPPPPPPAQRDEMMSPRDIGRLLRYGEQFGPHRIDVRMLPLQLPVPSGALAVMDPAAPKNFKVFDRPVVAGQFRVMLSVARSTEKHGNAERLAAIVIHVGRPPIAKWTVAHYKGSKKPTSPDDLPRLSVGGDWIAIVDAGSGSPGLLALPQKLAAIQAVDVPLTDGRRALALASGDGDFAAYWGVDAEDKAVCLVLDFETFSQKDWKAKPRS
ncbi:hypothetical protein BH11MYX2_BH11MYX2_30740 [soil metagenome]